MNRPCDHCGELALLLLAIVSCILINSQTSTHGINNYSQSLAFIYGTLGFSADFQNKIIQHGGDRTLFVAECGQVPGIYCHVKEGMSIQTCRTR